MKPLPILSKTSHLSFGLATQIRMGEPIAIDNEYKLEHYDDTVLQYAFRVDNERVLVVYAAYKQDPVVDIMVNVTDLFNIVKHHFGFNFNDLNVGRSLHEFASVFQEKDKDRILSRSFKVIEGSIMLSHRFHPGFFDSSEEFTMAIIGMLHGFARGIYKDVVTSLSLSMNERQYIYDVLTAINTLFPES